MVDDIRRAGNEVMSFDDAVAEVRPWTDHLAGIIIHDLVQTGHSNRLHDGHENPHRLLSHRNCQDTIDSQYRRSFQRY